MAGLRDAALISVVHTLLAGAAAWFWLALIGAERGGPAMAACAAPTVLALGLAFTSQADRRQYVVRLLACSAMLSILLLMWASSQDPGATGAPVGSEPGGWMAHPWLFFSACAAFHALLFVGTIWWLAAAVTRIEAAVASRVGPDRLAQRLRSLVDAGMPVDLAAGDHAHQWLLNLRLPASEGRSHRVRLDIDEPAGQVLVREQLGLRQAAPPRDADEASLRSAGDASFDPTRPDAQRISGRSIQTTMVDPDTLAAVRLHLVDGDARLLDPAPTEPEAIVTLLCALVTRSGYAWQPVLGRLR